MGDKNSSDWSRMGDELSELSDALQRLTQILPANKIHCNIAISGMALIEQRILKASKACYGYHDAYRQEA